MLKTRTFASLPNLSTSRNIPLAPAITNCPECRALVPLDATVCDCGYLFIDNLLMQNSSEPDGFRVAGRTRSVKKAIVIGVYLTAFLALVGYYGGYFDSSNAERKDDQSLSTTAPQSAPIKAPETVKESLPTMPFAGSVESVRTGDILTVTDESNRTFLLRLAGVTSPKLNEPFGIEAKNALAARALNKRVQVTPLTTDDDNLISDVLVDGTSLSIFQIQNGLGAYDESTAAPLSEDRRQQLALAETTARNNRYGLWTSPGSPDGDSRSAPTESPSLSQTAGSASRRTFRDPRNITLVNTDSVGKPADAQAALISVEPVENAAPPITLPPAPKVVAPPTTAPQSTISTRPEAAPAATAPPRKYVLGPRGGCYYLTPGGSKSYVDKSKCS